MTMFKSYFPNKFLTAAVLICGLFAVCQQSAAADGAGANASSQATPDAQARNETTSSSALFVAHDYLGDGTFTKLIEGPAVGPKGTLYLVGLGDPRNIARVIPRKDGNVHPEVFVKVPEGSRGNGIVFDDKGNMYVADYTGHNILYVNMDTREVSVFAHLPGANQPNDVAIAPDGTLYASDPDWDNGTGKLWRIEPDGSVKLLEKHMGTTNGITVSPDGNRLYVGESKQLKVWVYDIKPDGSLANKRLFMKFDHGDMDGMGVDVKGNVYISRYGMGAVLVVSPSGEVLHKVDLEGQKPSNLTFGGPDGRTVYVTVADRGAVEVFRSRYPGRLFKRD